jgi:hypothetical protein
MYKNSFVHVLVLLFGIFLLNGVYLLYPRETKSKELPGKIYEIYRVDPVEARHGSHIKLITVNYDGTITKHLCRSYSPVTALIELGYHISNMNKITATSPISQLYTNSFILVETYRTTIDEVLLEIPFQTVMKGNVLCKSLSQEVKEQEGVLGLMTQKVKRIYRGNTLIAEEIIEEHMEREARPEIIIIRGPEDLPTSVPQRGYNCAYWSAYIDGIDATIQEKEWLKFVMRWESGCNAESNKSFHKGLYQWDPCLWYKQYPNENIFDGEAQIRRTLEKLRNGANPSRMWPAVHKKYLSNCINWENGCL